MGIGALSYVEIDAWARLGGIVPTPLEVDILRAMDRAQLAATRETS
jgi:hypothetical protein